MQIFKTKYDGHIITKDAKGTINDYEGYALCPKSVQKQIDKGNYTELSEFAHDAIAYGYV